MDILTRQKIIDLLKAKSTYLASEYGVSKIGLFGSYAAGRPSDKSDVDIVIEFSRPIGFRFFDLVDYLESILGRKVDVLTPAGIDNIRVRHIAENITESIVYV
jgi:predicted nucleotidyltransferase